MKSLLCFIVCTCISVSVLADSERNTSVKAVGFTYIKALKSKSQLHEYLVNNWLAMDEIAVAQGVFEDYSLVVNGAQAHDWDFLMMITYKDSVGYAGIAKDFEKIRSTHQEVLMEGLGFKELGKIVKVEHHEQWY